MSSIGFLLGAMMHVCNPRILEAGKSHGYKVPGPNSKILMLKERVEGSHRKDLKAIATCRF